MALKPTVRILHNLARSGGTIISRCLGCMDGVALLSEIHPTRGLFDPAQQARDWYGIKAPSGLGFVDTIAAIETECRARGLALVLRSWDYVDFMPNPWICTTPPMRSMLAEALTSELETLGYSVNSVRLIRAAAPTWASMQKFLHPEQMPSELDFYRGWASYTYSRDWRADYEGFVEHPYMTMSRLCDNLCLPFDKQFLAKWHGYRNVTGDIASFDRTEIGPRNRRES